MLPAGMSRRMSASVPRRGIVKTGVAAAAGVGLSKLGRLGNVPGVSRSPGIARAQEIPDAPQAPRPIIVQIDNDPRARPSSNLGAASYVYEYTAEGGVTRFSAIYIGQDDVGTIGNIRSGRMATIDIVQQFNGILVYHGGSSGI